MRKLHLTGWLLASGLLCATPSSRYAFAQSRPTSPADESPHVRTVRSVHSIGPDLKVPLCPVRFHASLRTNSIASPGDQGVTPPRVTAKVPAPLTQQAISGAGRDHIGNFIVIVNVVVGTDGRPHDLCLQKSSGYGLDASAAAAVDQYRFQAASQNGHPVEMRMPVEVRFASQTPPDSSQPIPQQTHR